MAAAVELILLEDVEKLGRSGDIVRVKPGYARNFLLPKSLASLADYATKAQYEKRKAKLEADAEQRRAKAEENKARLEAQMEMGKTVTVTAKAGDAGKLYGSVTKEEIARAVEEQLDIKIDKSNIIIEEPIRELGVTEISLKLAAEIKAAVKVKVEAL